MDTLLTTNWLDANYSYLLAAASQIHDLLALHIAQVENQSFTATEQFCSLAALKDIMPAPPALEQLCNIFHLSEFERNILLLCVAREIIPNFKSLCVKAQGDKQLTLPTFGLARTLFSTFEWAALTHLAPLQHWQLVFVEAGDSIMESTLKIDQRIFYYLLGEPSLDPKLTGILQPIPLAGNDNTSLAASHQLIAEQLAKIWMQPTNTTLPLIQLCGANNTALRQIAMTASAFVECNLGLIVAKHLPSEKTNLQAISRRIEREVILNNSVILLDCFGANTEDTVFIQTISQLTEDGRIPLIITSRDRLPLTQETYITFDVPKLTANEQLAIWQNALGSATVELNPTVETLVSQFNLSSKAIYTAVSTAKGTSNTNEASLIDSNNLATALWDSCRLMARPLLDDLAQRINTTATWDDLVLGEKQQLLLREMIIHVSANG